jgi:hypothetical protein
LPERQEAGQAIARLIEKEFLVRGGHGDRVSAMGFSPDGGVPAGGLETGR